METINFQRSFHKFINGMTTTPSNGPYKAITAVLNLYIWWKHLSNIIRYFPMNILSIDNQRIMSQLPDQTPLFKLVKIELSSKRLIQEWHNPNRQGNESHLVQYYPKKILLLFHIILMSKIIKKPVKQSIKVAFCHFAAIISNWSIIYWIENWAKNSVECQTII